MKFNAPSKLSPSRRAGFTLIELLAVIGVIAILMALLFPFLSTMSEKAKSVTCLNNLKQMGAGVAMYANENNLWLPNSSGVQNEIAGTSLWTEQVAPYVLGATFTPDENTAIPFILERRKQAMRVFICPSAPGDLRSRSEGSPGNFGPTNYAYNNRCGLQTYGDYGPVKLLNVSRASEAVLIADAGRHYMPTCAEFYNFQEMGKLHHGGANLRYLDGHIGWAIPSTLDAESQRNINGAPYYWAWGQGSGN